MEEEDWLMADDEKAMTRFAIAVQRTTTLCHVSEGIRECVRIRTNEKKPCLWGNKNWPPSMKVQKL